jgi:hypothetical protein
MTESHRHANPTINLTDKVEKFVGILEQVRHQNELEAVKNEQLLEGIKRITDQS